MQLWGIDVFIILATVSLQRFLFLKDLMSLWGKSGHVVCYKGQVIIVTISWVLESVTLPISQPVAFFHKLNVLVGPL